MAFIIEALATYASYIYAACGLVALYHIYKLWQVRSERRQAVFSLEREKAVRELFAIFYVAMILLAVMGGTYFVSTTLAEAVEPITAQSRDPNPALPFALSALAVGVSALALVRVERALPATPKVAVAATAVASDRASSAAWGQLLVIALLLAFGQQLHTAINSVPQFRRLADPALLPWLLPVFWVGFSFGLLLVDRLVRGRGPLPVLQLASAAGALALSGAAIAPGAGSLPLLVASQFAAGGFWGFILCASIGVAAERGYPLQTGRNTGALMATLAVAAMSRLSLMASGGAAGGSLVEWLPAVTWAAAALVLLRLRSV